MKDLDSRIIRAVGDPKKRFSEDALRILRAFRFASQLEFEIEDDTLRGAYECAHLLKNIARERIGAEMKKLISSRGVVYSLEKMIEGGVFGEIFGAFLPKNEVILRLSDVGNGDFALRFAILLGEASEGDRTFILDSLRLSNAEKKLILRLCTVQNFDAFGGDISKNARRFLHFYGDILSQARGIFEFYYPDSVDFLRVIDEENAKKRPLSVSDLAVRGQDLLGICEGDYSRVGKILKQLLDAVIDDPDLNEKAKLIEIAKKSR
jgi:tRNA nucleotidyltransferase (CCA-adding enzyme)